MKSQLLTVLAFAALLLGVTTACNRNRIDIETLEKDLVGLWWDEYEHSDVTEAGVPFDRVLLAVKADADHTGCIYLGVYNSADNRPLAVYGGPEDAGFTWRLLEDGSLMLNEMPGVKSTALTRADSGSGNYGDDMTNVSGTDAAYANGSVTVSNGSYSGTLDKADSGTETKIEEQLSRVVIDLADLTTDYEARNGDILTGTLGNPVKITIADGAVITLKDVTINGIDEKKYQWAGLTPVGDATIVLEGSNKVKGFNQDYPGIFAAVGHMLTLTGSGSLESSSNGGGAGIGGGAVVSVTESAENPISCGDITIRQATITAIGGERGAGIGGGTNASCGDITIESGHVTASSERNSAGIGGGGQLLTRRVSCGNITIQGGTVIAHGGLHAAGIGSGACPFSLSPIGNIAITGGTITAVGGEESAGIGCGGAGRCGNITITQDVTRVEATKGNNALYSIGPDSELGTCGTVTVGDKEGYVSESPFVYMP